MSSAPEGWYVDPSTGTNLRRWNGHTWTDEVAPLPHEPAHSAPVDHFATAAPDTPASDTPASDTPVSGASAVSDTLAASGTSTVSAASEAADAVETPDTTETAETADTAETPDTPETAETPETPDTLPEGSEPTESIPEGLPDQAPGDGTSVEGGLDPEIELTQLTRRELRARRGDEPVPDDTPKHLPPITPVTVVPIEHWREPVEELEIPSPAAEEDSEDADPARRRRIVRLSVLLGVLAVVSSVAVLTAGTI